MDYLLRDSHYCGVQYGTFDLDRILNTLILDTEASQGSLKLAIDEDGIHALTGFVLARYYMFKQVYFHDVRRAYDLVLTDFIAELLEAETSQGKYPGIDKIEEYLTWDDSRVLFQALERSDPEKRNLAWRVINRQHPKEVYATEDSPDSGLARKVDRELLNAVRTEFPELQFWLDRAVDHPDRFRLAEMMVRIAGNPSDWREFRKVSDPLKGLQDIGKCRLYADVRGDADQESEVRRFCRSIMA